METIFLCGICVDCKLRLGDRINRKPNPRKLFIPLGFELGTVNVDGKCTCYICHVAGLSGGALKAFRSKSKADAAGDQGADVRRCNQCFGEVLVGQRHTNCGGKQRLLENLKSALPLDVRQQFALETLKEMKDSQGAGGDASVLHLQSHKGGKPTEVTIGSRKSSSTSSSSSSSSSQLTGENARSMVLKHNLNQGQLRGLLADWRCLNGKGSVEPYILENILKSKEALKALYTVEMVNFMAKVCSGL